MTDLPHTSAAPAGSVKSLKRGRHYLTSAQVRERYGGRSGVWLWRKLRYDATFPRPLVTGNSKLRLWDEEALDAYDDEFMKASTAEPVEP